MRPVALDREFQWLSNNIKITKFGLANLKLFNFKVCAVLENVWKSLKRI
jgi:IS4 transposase